MARWRRPRVKYRRRLGAADVGSAGSFTRQVLDQYNISADVHAHQLITDWERIVGARVAARTTPMNAGSAMESGALTVRVANSAWLHELSFIKDQLVVKVNEYVGTKDRPEPIREIRFFHGRGPKGRADELQQARAQQHREALKPRALPAPATGENLARIEHETANVDDPELRKIIRRARRLLDT